MTARRTAKARRQAIAENQTFDCRPLLPDQLKALVINVTVVAIDVIPDGIIGVRV